MPISIRIPIRSTEHGARDWVGVSVTNEQRPERLGDKENPEQNRTYHTSNVLQDNEIMGSYRPKLLTQWIQGYLYGRDAGLV